MTQENADHRAQNSILPEISLWCQTNPGNRPLREVVEALREVKRTGLSPQTLRCGVKENGRSCIATNHKVKIDMNEPEKDDATILNRMETAIENGDAAELKFLLDEDPKRLYMKSVFGSWLHVAAMHGQLPIAKQLLDAGIDINGRSGLKGGAAIEMAASDGHVELVRYLIAKGAELDVSAPERNPLYGAALYGHDEIAKLLLEAGLDPRVHNGFITAEELARTHGHKSTAALIRKYTK